MAKISRVPIGTGCVNIRDAEQIVRLLKQHKIAATAQQIVSHTLVMNENGKKTCIHEMSWQVFVHWDDARIAQRIISESK